MDGHSKLEGRSGANDKYRPYVVRYRARVIDQSPRGNICVAESASSLHCGIHIFMIVYIFDNSTIASHMIFNDVI